MRQFRRISNVFFILASLALQGGISYVRAVETLGTFYVRPGMQRPQFLSLDGNWNSTVSSRWQTNVGKNFEVVTIPCPGETLQKGGRGRLVTDIQRIWYKRNFDVPTDWKRSRVLLHFEAVDWESEVWVNGRELASHRGGYDRFTFDITDALKSEGEQELIVSVWDPTDAGYQPRGKQMQHPKEPFFHATSGIWQSVWLEPVPDRSIESLKLVPDIDSGILKIIAFERGETNGSSVEAVAYDGGKEVARCSGVPGQEFSLPVPNAKLWSPDSPFLYDLKVLLFVNGKKVDEVSSYFGMRKISVGKDEQGNPRLFLNNKPLFQLGPLDQGYWPEGIYTAPSDEAMRHDIEVMKRLGFNMCRKHVKIEPDRWYYWCDKLGLLVWQDMPNGDRDALSQSKEIQRTPESAKQFELELRRMVEQRGNHPCIVMWIPFNQGWGQYDTTRITDLVKQLDPSRLVISASGWHDMGCGDVRSLHIYSENLNAIQDGKRPCVLGECGALGLVVPDHLWGRIGRWNINYCKTPEDLWKNYQVLLSNINTLKKEKGLSAAVITQLTDVETELDGFMTYDRQVIKMPVEKVRVLNEELTNER